MDLIVLADTQDTTPEQAPAPTVIVKEEVEDPEFQDRLKSGGDKVLLVT